MTGTYEATVVVALVPGGDCIGAIVAALRRQDERRFELVIVDIRGAGPDEGRRLAAAAAGAGVDARHVPLASARRAAANNVGIRLARTELVILLAHDFVPTPSFLSAHLALHRREPDRRVVGIGPGVFRPSLRADPFRRWIEDSGELFGASFTGQHPFPRGFFYCANVSAKRRFLCEAGLFDEDFPHDAWDDCELGLRLVRKGMRSVLVPDAVAWHDHPVTLEERVRSMTKVGEAAAIFERKHEGPHPWQQPAPDGGGRSGHDHWRRLRSLLTPGRRPRPEDWRERIDAAFRSAYEVVRERDRPIAQDPSEGAPE